jgi:hypothetical protein
VPPLAVSLCLVRRIIDPFGSVAKLGFGGKIRAEV